MKMFKLIKAMQLRKKVQEPIEKVNEYYRSNSPLKTYIVKWVSVNINFKGVLFMVKLKPFNMEEYRQITNPYDKMLAKERYLEWLESERKKDRHQSEKQRKRIISFKYRKKYPEKVKESREKYYKKIRLNRNSKYKRKKIYGGFLFCDGHRINYSVHVYKDNSTTIIINGWYPWIKLLIYYVGQH